MSQLIYNFRDEAKCRLVSGALARFVGSGFPDERNSTDVTFGQAHVFIALRLTGCFG